MSIKLDIISASGNKESLKSAGKIAARTRFGLQKAFYFVGKDLISEFNRQVLAKNKSGRLYVRKIRGGARRKHRSSASGQTPANRTGTYRKGIGFKVQGSKQLKFGNDVDYAGFLELGTSRMKARPGLGNTVKASERNIIRNLANNIEEAL